MLTPRIIEGTPFDWEKAREEVEERLGPDGELTFAAAMCADPGCMSCPFCSSLMSREGTVVECPVCEQRFNTNWRDVARRATGVDPVVRRNDNTSNANIVEILFDVVKGADEGKPFGLPPRCPPIVVRFAELAAGIDPDAPEPDFYGPYDETL